MKKSVELPIVEPIYSTYHYQGSACSVIAKNPSIRNWYLSNALVLCCHNQFLYGAYTPQLTVNNTYEHQNPYLERDLVSTKHIQPHIHSVIRKLLDNEYYVYFTDVDDYYIKGKSWYKTRHFNHDGLICGYDQNDQTYSIFAYNGDWKYRVFKTPQRNFKNGILANAEKGIYSELHGFRPLNIDISVEPELVLKNIREYLDSSFEKYPTTISQFIYGNITHDYIAMYLDCLLDERISYERMDWRIFRVIWEQKKVMQEALDKTEDILRLDKSISTEYKKIITMADKMRLLYASHHMKRRDSLLPGIITLLLESKHIEAELLSEFCEKAERVIDV